MQHVLLPSCLHLEGSISVNNDLNEKLLATVCQKTPNMLSVFYIFSQFFLPLWYWNIEADLNLYPFLYHFYWGSFLWMYFNYFHISCFPGDKDGSKVTTVVATPGQGPDRPQEVSYTDTKVIGNGSFGVVYQAKLCDSGELVAIKKVLQDKRFKVRICITSEYFSRILSCFPFLWW